MTTIVWMLTALLVLGAGGAMLLVAFVGVIVHGASAIFHGTAWVVHWGEQQVGGREVRYPQDLLADDDGSGVVE